MAFYGYQLSFNGIPCYEYGLMIYDFDNTRQGDGVFSSAEIVEDRIAGRYASFYYGLEQNEPLEFTLVFGADMNSVNMKEHLDRYDIEAISAWLTGVDGYRYLEIEQPDMEEFRYKCIITDLEFLTSGWMPWAFKCKVHCDSPFAYTYPEEISYSVDSTKQIHFFNRSTYNGYYKPNMKLTLKNGSSDFAIINHSDENRQFLFHNIPNPSERIIWIDNQNGIITSDSGDNLYPYFNFKFLRLLRGNNTLEIQGDGVVTFICEFPVSIGG